MESIDIISSNNGETFNKQLLNFSEKYKIKKEKNAKRISEWRENQTDTKTVTHYEQPCNTPCRETGRLGLERHPRSRSAHRSRAHRDRSPTRFRSATRQRRQSPSPRAPIGGGDAMMRLVLA